MTKKLLFFASIGLLLCSCGNNNNQSVNSNNQKIITDTAFVKLDKYEYIDNTNGDYSGGSKDGRSIKIFASTNFPDGTVIDVQTTGFIVSSKKGGMSDTYAEVKVQDGKLTANLNPWNITDTIEFRIFPEKQSKEIIDIVGQKGEKLKLKENNKPEFEGIVLFQSDNFPVNEDIINKIKGIKATVYKIQKASELSKPYEKALAEFVKCWKNKDWDSMVRFCQISEGVSSKDLSSKFDIIKIDGFQVTKSREGALLPSGNVLMEVEFDLVVESSNEMKGIQNKKMKANVIQENNKWGVNSTSVTRGLYD